MKFRLIALTAIILLSTAATAALPERDLLDGVNPGPDGMIDVLAVFAHQDDETFYAGGTLLKLKDDPRVRLRFLCLTLGDKSDAINKLGITGERLGRIRSQELETAAAVYQAEEVIQFQYLDQELARADQERLIEEIRKVIDETGTEIVITHDPAGISGHPDHKTCSRAATEAFRRSAAQKLYYATLPEWIYKAIYRGETEPVYAEFRVNIRQHKKIKRLALYSHATQRHFSYIGFLMEAVRILDYEYFAEMNR